MLLMLSRWPFFPHTVLASNCSLCLWQSTFVPNFISNSSRSLMKRPTDAWYSSQSCRVWHALKSKRTHGVRKHGEKQVQTRILDGLKTPAKNYIIYLISAKQRAPQQSQKLKRQQLMGKESGQLHQIRNKLEVCKRQTQKLHHG